MWFVCVPIIAARRFASTASRSHSTSRVVLLNYIGESNRLAETPRWYIALTHNYTTMIRPHVQRVAADALGCLAQLRATSHTRSYNSKSIDPRSSQ